MSGNILSYTKIIAVPFQTGLFTGVYLLLKRNKFILSQKEYSILFDSLVISNNLSNDN